MVKLARTIVAGFIASLKVAVTVLATATPVAPEAGIIDTTVGGVVSAATPVVKVHTIGAARAVPATSLTPVVMVAV
jgi:hypothetical protein